MPETLLQLLGETVRARRTLLGLSQAELARRTGLHPTYIGGIERGERNVGVLNLTRLAHALNVPPSSLLHPLDLRPDLYPSSREKPS
jgi:transcriptional regulator with XRE-family HTH domain